MKRGEHYTNDYNERATVESWNSTHVLFRIGDGELLKLRRDVFERRYREDGHGAEEPEDTFALRDVGPVTLEIRHGRYA